MRYYNVRFKGMTFLKNQIYLLNPYIPFVHLNTTLSYLNKLHTSLENKVQKSRLKHKEFIKCFHI